MNGPLFDARVASPFFNIVYELYVITQSGKKFAYMTIVADSNIDLFFLTVQGIDYVKMEEQHVSRSTI